MTVGPGGGDQAPTFKGFDPGRRVGSGRFRLKKLLGQGGMGIVWLAEDERLKENVALKFLPPQIRFDVTALDDLRRETLRSRRLTHTHIIRIHDLFEADAEDPFITMEFVDGPTLSNLRVQQSGRVFSWEYLRPMIRHLCDALDYAHNERVIHRDLKPSNLMVDSRGRLKLADFGIARVVTDSLSRITARQGTSGTLIYMSPQQLDGKVPQIADDVYSLGATLYELLTSRPPFFTGDIHYQIRSVVPDRMADRLGDLKIINELPVAVEETVAACLAKDPAQRPSSARVVAEGLGCLEHKIPTSKRQRPATAASGTNQRAPVAGPKTRPLILGVCALLLMGAWVWQRTWDSALPEPGFLRSPTNQTRVFPRPSGVGTMAPTQEISVARTPATNDAVSIPARLLVTDEITPAADLSPPSTVKITSKFPKPNAPWTNSLGMVFAPVTGNRLFAIWETRVSDYAAFTNATKHPVDARWRDKQYAGNPLNPMVFVSWHDARKFCEWLTEKDQREQGLAPNQSYRLPTDVEWSQAVKLPPEPGKSPKERNGKLKRFYAWGETFPPVTNTVNLSGREVSERSYFGSRTLENYRDNYPGLAPVGSFPANALGLFDLGGNVAEWCEDAMEPQKETKVLRGGAWSTYDAAEMLASHRGSLGPKYRLPEVGFRCVLVLAPEGE